MLFIVDKCARNRGQLLYLVLSRAIVSYMFNAPRRDGHRGGPKGVASPIVTKISMTFTKVSSMTLYQQDGAILLSTVHHPKPHGSTKSLASESVPETGKVRVESKTCSACHFSCLQREWGV